MHARLKKYSMAFSTGSLYVGEVESAVEWFESLKNWTEVRETLKAGNYLQQRAPRSILRVTREVVSRAQCLSRAERDYLMKTSRLEQGYLAWIAACRQYPFIAEFATEVLRERYVSFIRVLQAEQFEAFFEQKSELHPELEGIKESTRNKLRQVLFKMMKEAELIDEGGFICSVLMSKDFVRVLAKSDVTSFHYLPVFDGDIEKKNES